MSVATNESAVHVEAVLDWPPYGNLNVEQQWRRDTNRVPDAFTMKGRKATPLEYKKYVESEAEQMAEWLWPIYDRTLLRWRGGAIAHAKSLTVADLDLMDELRAYLGKEAKCLDRGLKTTHKALFLMEDESAKPSLETYVPMLSFELLASVRAAVDRGLQGVVAMTHWRFKEQFQRPRPYQIAYLMGRKFEYQFAKSAPSPSMISAHCLQGLLGRTPVFMAMKLELEAIPECIESLQQYCVDIGDHRVMAGVHYPSDNISSWFIALRQCDHVFGELGQMAKNFMWEAISKRSIVYHHIEEAAKKAGSPYHALCQRLQDEAHRPAERTDS